MSEQVVFKGVFPIGDTNPQALPIRKLGPAIAFYTAVMGFEVVERDGNLALLKRDDVTIGLEENKSDPEQASCYFRVENIEGLHAEYTAKLLEPSGLILDTSHGKQRIFFTQEPYGVCFCFGEPITE